MKARSLFAGVCFIAGLINVYLTALYSGFERGTSYASEVHKECIDLGFSGGSLYDTIADYHFALFISLLVLSLLFMARGIFADVASCLVFVFVSLKVYQWYGQVAILGDYSSDPYYKLVFDTVVLGWISVGLIVILLGAKLMLVRTSLSRKTTIDAHRDSER